MRSAKASPIRSAYGAYPLPDELLRRLGAGRVDVVVGALLDHVAQAPRPGRHLPRHDIVEGEVGRQVDHRAVLADREGRDRGRLLEVQVAAVPAGEAHEPRALD